MPIDFRVRSFVRRIPAEDTGMVVRTGEGVTIFSTHKIPDGVLKALAQSFEELCEMSGDETPSIGNVFIGEGEEAVVLVRRGLVLTPDGPLATIFEPASDAPPTGDGDL